MPRRFVYLIPLLVGAVLTTAIYLALLAEQRGYEQKLRGQLFHKLTILRDSFQDAVADRLRLSTMLKATIPLAPDMNQSTFESTAKGLLTNMTGIQLIGLAPDGVLTRSYPTGPETLPFGGDLQKEAPMFIRHMLGRALTTGREQLSPPVEILPGSKSIVTLTPVILHPAQSGEPPVLWGCIMEIIRAETLFRESGIAAVHPDLVLAIRSISPGGDYSNVFGLNDVFESAPVTLDMAIADEFWQLAAVPAGGWHNSPNRPIFIGLGLLAVLTVTGILFLAVHLFLRHMKERERYTYVVQNARAIILRMDIGGNIAYCNEFAEQFLGYEPGELLGMPVVGTILPDKDSSGNSMKRQVIKLLSDPDRRPFQESICTRKNGELMWVSWAVQPLRRPDGSIEGVLCVGMDITDRKNMEKVLVQRQRQLEMLISNIPDVILGLDADNRYTYITPSDEKIRGFPSYDVLGQPITQFLTQRSVHAFDDAVNTLYASEFHATGQTRNTTLDLEFLRADGTTLWMEVSLGTLHNEDGLTVGLQGVARDITDRLLAQNMREDMERMARHDLKTPLGAVIGLPQEIMRTGNLTHAQTIMLTTIQEAGESMLRLINRSLDLFKLESGSYPLKKETVDVMRVLEHIQEETRHLCQEKGISLGFENRIAQAGVSFDVEADVDLFRSMLSNLILNSLQASPEERAVTITLNKDTAVSIAIRNQGEVPEEIRDSFFDKYATSGNGSGLGTYSARLIARAHGGDIRLDARVPDETTVIVTLPL